MRVNTGWSHIWKAAVWDIFSYASLIQLNSCFIKLYYELSEHNSSCYLYPSRLICSIFPIKTLWGQFCIGVEWEDVPEFHILSNMLPNTLKWKSLLFCRYVTYYKKLIQDRVACCLYTATDVLSKSLLFKKKKIMGEVYISKYTLTSIP